MTVTEDETILAFKAIVAVLNSKVAGSRAIVPVSD
jgi:hypothetical protein